jgi:hypothetical protein
LTEKLRRIVLDTDVFVSAVLRRGSVPAKAVDRAFRDATVLTSAEVLRELEEVLRRPKFARSRSLAEREELLSAYAAAFDPVEIAHNVNDCRDAKDNKFS